MFGQDISADAENNDHGLTIRDAAKGTARVQKSLLQAPTKMVYRGGCDLAQMRLQPLHVRCPGRGRA